MQINYHRFRDELLPFKSFSLVDARKHFPGFDRKRLTEWQNKGYLRRWVKGHYSFTETAISEGLLWFVSNKIYNPSYISLQTALSHYGFIPEAVFEITAISTRRTQSFATDRGTFSYRNIKPTAYFGYRLLAWGDTRICFAEPEKALADVLYLNPRLRSPEDFDEMRFNKSEIAATCDLEKLETYIAAMKNKALQARFRQFQNWWHA